MNVKIDKMVFGINGTYKEFIPRLNEIYNELHLYGHMYMSKETVKELLDKHETNREIILSEFDDSNKLIFTLWKGCSICEA